MTALVWKPGFYNPDTLKCETPSGNLVGYTTPTPEGYMATVLPTEGPPWRNTDREFPTLEEAKAFVLETLGVGDSTTPDKIRRATPWQERYEVARAYLKDHPAAKWQEVYEAYRAAGVRCSYTAAYKDTQRVKKELGI